jgi:hypothetical protein
LWAAIRIDLFIGGQVRYDAFVGELDQVMVNTPFESRDDP